MEWLDTKTIYTLLHLFGVTLGAGGSFMSDVIFVSTTKDKILDKSEFDILKKGSAVTWVGLVLLVVSGAMLVSLDFQTYFASSKFILKMIIVGVVIVNGFVFHFVHTPRLRDLVGIHLSRSSRFRSYSRAMYYSGAVSIVSWVSALILGGLRVIPVSVTAGLCVYLGLIGVAVVGAEYKRREFLNIKIGK
jgi:hypothetical protein